MGALFFFYIVGRTLVDSSYLTFDDEKDTAGQLVWWNFNTPNRVLNARPTTLEWILSSPPAFHSYNELPQVIEVTHLESALFAGKIKE